MKYFINQSPAAAATTLSAGFSTTTPGDDATNVTEPTIGTGGYARQAVTFGAVATPAAGAAVVASNSAVITWGPSSAAWSSGTNPLTNLCLWNASTGTTEAVFEAFGAISVAPQVAGSQVTLTCAVGALQVNLTPT